RRIGPLVEQYAEPRIEMHPQMAQKLGLTDGEWATVESRRGSVTLRLQVVTTIRPDTVFVPYHWPGPKSINQVTIAAQDPTSKILRAFYRVYNVLGHGFLEKVYQNSLTIELRKMGLDVQPRAPIKVYYEGEEVGEYVADLLVEACVIVELKAAEALCDEHHA